MIRKALKMIGTTENWLYLYAATIPFFAVSPWRTLFRVPVGFISAAVFMILLLSLLINDRKVVLSVLTGQQKNITILLGAFFIVQCISLILNWGLARKGPYMDWAVGLQAPHVYNIFLLIYLAFNIVVLMAVSASINKSKMLDGILRTYVIASVLACIFGLIVLIGYEFGFNTPQFYGSGGTIPSRMLGTATEPQVFASFLLTALPLAMLLFIMKKDLIPLWASWITLFVLCLSMYLTFGIVGWVGVVISGMMIFIDPRAIDRKRVGQFAAIIVVTVLTINFLTMITGTDYNGGMNFAINKLKFWELGKKIEGYEKMKKPNVDVFDPLKVYAGDDTKLDRYWMAVAAVDMFKSHPVVGVGSGNYAFLYNNYRPKGSPIKPHLPKPHNAYLEVLAESGILGFIAFVSFLFLLMMKALMTLFSKGDDNRAVHTALFGCFIALLFNGSSLGILAHTYTWFLFALLLSSLGIKKRGKG